VLSVPRDVQLPAPEPPGEALGGPRGPESSEELDPELLALPDPPRRERTLTVAVMALAALLSLTMVFAVRHDISYALRGASDADASDLGDLHATSPAGLTASDNGFVRAEALLGAAGGIRYERPFVDDSFRTLQVAGRPDVWVDVRVPAGQENGRWEPPRTFQGRLVRFDSAGPRHRGLAGAIQRASGAQVPAGAWLLVDGEAPDKARWTLLLAALFVACAAWNLVAIRGLLRRVR